MTATGPGNPEEEMEENPGRTRLRMRSVPALAVAVILVAPTQAITQRGELTLEAGVLSGVVGYALSIVSSARCSLLTSIFRRDTMYRIGARLVRRPSSHPSCEGPQTQNPWILGFDPLSLLTHRAALHAHRISLSLGLALVMSASLSPSLVAQDRPEFIAGLGGGMSLYAISTRVDTGTILRGSVGYSPIPWLVMEAGARWHGCFDCDRFSILEGGVQLRRPGHRFSPFAAAGGGRSSDPEFMGSEWGLHAAGGSWLWLSDDWGLQVEARGRQVGSGAHMGEFTAGVARRFRRPRG